MASDNFDELLREATDAAREGKIAAARRILKQLIKEDANSVKVWMLMYRVSDNLADKRDALRQVLRIEPDNTRAKEQLDKLQAKLGGDDEVAPGINRRQLTMIGGGLAILILVLAVVAISIIGNNNAQNASLTATANAVSAAFTQAAMQPTYDFETLVAEQTSAQETLLAQFTATPTATIEVVGGAPTLPPLFTETSTQLPLMSPTPLAAPPADVPGMLIASGGPDLENNGYLPVVTVSLNGNGLFRPISAGDEGRYPSAVNTNRIIYTLYSRQTFEYTLSLIDLPNAKTEALANLWQGSAVGKLFAADEAQMTYDNNKLIFTAQAQNGRREIFLFDFNAVGADPVVAITTDDNDYAFPSLSPDGRTVIASRSSTNNLTGEFVVDLFLITLANGDLRPITSDASTSHETMARYSPDGREVVYAANAGSDTPHDIYLRSSDGIGPALPVASSPGDDILPVYSPDGRYIAFSSNRSGSGYNIYIYDKSNGALYQLTNSGDDFFVGGWVLN